MSHDKEAECVTFFDCDMNREVQTIKLSENWTNVSRAISITKQADLDRICEGANHHGNSHQYISATEGLGDKFIVSSKDLGHFGKALYRKLGLFWQISFLCSHSQL